MTDDQTLLASTYLDGQATAAERAQVEGDAELLAEVERLQLVRALLISSDDDAAAPISTRERHLAAALDAWDRVPTNDAGADATPGGLDAAGAAGGATITAPISMRDQRAKRRPISTKLLTAAAAVIVLGGVGLVVTGALDNSSDDDSASVADDADMGLETTEERSLDELAAEEFVTEGDGSAADDVADAAAPAPAVEPEDATAGGPDQAPPEDVLEILDGNEDLARFANNLVLARTNATTAVIESDEASADTESADGDDAATQADPAEAPVETSPPTLPAPVDLCGLIDDFAGFAIWQSVDRFDEAIAVGIDNSTGEAVAYQPSTCSLVSRTPLP